MAKGWPKITVVTPSYNQGRFIEETITSVIDQDYPNLEHIVMDGGSTDDTKAILERYSDQLAFWASERDEGQTDALIKGFRRATGDILCWLNSDDLFEPGTLRFVGSMFREQPTLRFLYGDSTWVDPDNKYLRPKKEHAYNRFIWLHDHNFFPQPSCFWRRDLYEEVGGLDKRFDLAMDADLFIRFAERTKPVHVRRTFSRMRSYPEQKNKKFRVRSDQEDAEIRARFVSPAPPVVRRARWLVAKTLRVGMKVATGAYFR